MTLRRQFGSAPPNFIVEDETLIHYWVEKQHSHAERAMTKAVSAPRIDNHAHYVAKKLKKHVTGNEVVLEIIREFDLDNLFKYIRNCYLGMKLNEKSKNNRTLLHTVASVAQDLTPSTAMVEAVFLSKLILKSGININDQDVQGNTALHLVVNNADHTYLCFLLRNGADPHILNDDKKSPLDIARTYCTGKEDESAGGLLLKCYNNYFLIQPKLDVLHETRRFSLSIAFILANMASLVYKRKQSVSTSDVHLVPESLYSSTTNFIRRPHWNNIIAHSIAKRWGFETAIVIDDITRCLICKYKNIWVVSFKGTDKIEDFFADLNVISMEEDRYVGGTYKLLIRIWPQIVSVLPKYSREYAETLIYCTGHSMGGALATMCADFLVTKENYPTKNVILYSFASPRCGTVDLRNSIATLNHAYAVVRCGDPIPHLPMPTLFSASNCGSVRYLDENGKLFNDPHYKFHDIARETNRITDNMLDHCTMWIAGVTKFREDDIPIGCFPEHKRALVCKIIDTIRNPTEAVQTVKKPHDMHGYQTDIFNLHRLVTKPVIDRPKDLITSQNIQKIDIPEGYLDRYTSERMYEEREEALDNWARNYGKTSKVEPFTFTEDTETGVIVNWFESEMDILIKLDQLEQTIRTNPKFETKIPNFTIPLLPMQKVKISPYVQCKLLRILQLIYYSIQSYSMSKQLYYAVLDLPAGWAMEPKLIIENNLLVPEYIQLPNTSIKVQQIKIIEKSVNFSKTILVLADHLLNEIEKVVKEPIKSPRETNQSSSEGNQTSRSTEENITPRRRGSESEEKLYRRKFLVKLRYFKTTTSTGFRYDSSLVRGTIKKLIYKPENYQEKFNEIRDKEQLGALNKLEEFVIIFYSYKIYSVNNPEIAGFFSKFKNVEILRTLQNSEFELRIQGRKFKIIINYKNMVMETALNYLSFKLVKNLHLFKFQGFFKKENQIFPFVLVSEEENSASLENYLFLSYFDEENSIAQYSRLFLLNLALILTGEIADFSTFDHKGKKKLLNSRELTSELTQKYPVNILFCLNEIHLPVHKNILADFKELNLKLIIEKWGKHLRESDSLLHTFSNSSTITPEFFSHSHFNEIWLVNFTNRIYNIQKFWAKKKNPTHLDTLLHIFPEHKELFHSIFYELRNPVDRFYLLQNKFLREFQTSTSHAPGECAAIYATRNANTSRPSLVTRSVSSSSSSEFLHERSSSSTGSAIQAAPKTSIVNYIFDSGGLESIEKGKSMLLDFVKKSNNPTSSEILAFKHSFLAEFEKLRDSSTVELFLETIQLELAPIKEPDARRTLQTFILDGLCERKYGLVIINLSNFDYLDNCALDKIFRLNSKTITTISIRDCSRLTQIGVSGWFKNITHLPNLEKLDLSGCNSIDDCSKFFIEPNPTAKIVTTSRLRVKKNTPERIFTQILPCLCRTNANIYCSDDLDKNSLQQIQNLIAAGICPPTVLNK